MGTYECRASVKGRRGSRDELRVMQRPTLRGDGGRCGNGEAREAERWREDGRKKKKGERLAKPIYKGISEQASAKNEEDQNNDYPAKRTPRFSEDIKR